MRSEGKKLAQVARIQARGLLTNPKQIEEDADVLTDAAAAFGFHVVRRDTDGERDDPCYLWPCNVPTWHIWGRLQSQWRVGGMGGRTGLDYTGVHTYLREVLGIKPKALPTLFSELQAMEFASLEEWDKRLAEKQNTT